MNRIIIYPALFIIGISLWISLSKSITTNPSTGSKPSRAFRRSVFKGRANHWLGIGLLGLLAGCAHVPNGPSVMALPGSRLSFEQFRQDDYICQDYASGRIGGSNANQASTDSQIGTAMAGTAIGAAAGAAFGGGPGAAIGAGGGLLAGSAVGVGEGRRSASATQEGYDNAYVQCMYGKGHRVPVSGQFSDENQPPSPQLSAPIPPPPAGTPPPPPKR
jgi:hypothetical protein